MGQPQESYGRQVNNTGTFDFLSRKSSHTTLGHVINYINEMFAVPSSTFWSL
jgi:hypothetical protein